MLPMPINVTEDMALRAEPLMEHYFSIYSEHHGKYELNLA